jgi:hypothetical protein
MLGKGFTMNKLVLLVSLFFIGAAFGMQDNNRNRNATVKKLVNIAQSNNEAVSSGLDSGKKFMAGVVGFLFGATLIEYACYSGFIRTQEALSFLENWHDKLATGFYLIVTPYLLYKIGRSQKVLEKNAQELAALKKELEPSAGVSQS